MAVPIDPIAQQIVAVIPQINVTVQPPPEGPWYKVPDWWVAGGTVVLALVTFVLAFYTWRLFRAALKAHEDSDKALRIAKDQMARSLRAYVIVDSVAEKTKIGGDGLIPAMVTLTITNAGQIPSHDTTVEWTTMIHLSQTPTQPEHCDTGEPKRQWRGILGNGQKIPIDVEFPGALLNKHANGITFGGRELILRGTISYRDGIADELRKTDFNYVWHVQRGYFLPKEEVGNTMT